MPIHKEVNKNFFKKWSSNMAYILGFLFADGNIVRTKRNTHFVAFYNLDRALLIKMRDGMGSTHIISIHKSKKGYVYRLQIGSVEIFDDLVALGLTPNKAKRMRLPEIPSKYVGDFIRGYFDGDGCVWHGITHSNRKKQTQGILVCFTSASMGFLSDLFYTLKKRGVLGGSLFKSRKGNYSRLSFSTLDSLKIYKIMYNGSHKLFLPRKKLVFERFMRMRP